MYLGNLSRIPHHSKLYQTLYQILLQRYSFVLLDIIYCKKYEIIMLKHIYYVTLCRHPAYILHRFHELPKPSVFKLKVLLLLVDIPVSSCANDMYPPSSASTSNISPVQALNDINKLCFQMEITLICAFSAVECGRYIETLKVYEAKASISIQEKPETDYVPKVTQLLTNSIPGINKTDVVTLLNNFKTVKNICTRSSS